MTTDKIIHTPLCAPPLAQKNKFFKLSNVLDKEHYRLKADKSSEYQPAPPELASSTGSKRKVSQYTVSAQNLLHTKELMRRAAIYGSITDSLVVSILQYITEEARDKVVQEQVRIMHKSSHKTIASGAVAASNFQLICRDMALGQLQDEHIARARTAPFHGQCLVRLEPQRFDEKIFIMRDQHALHRGLTSHFKVPKKPPPKSSTQSRPSVHQRLGPPVGQEGSIYITSPFELDSRTCQEAAASSPLQEAQGVHLGTPAEGRRLLCPRRWLDHRRVPDNEDSLVWARLASFAQQWQNLLSVCRSSRTVWSG